MFEVVSSVALRVVLSVLSDALRLYGMLLWGCFEGCFEVVLRLFGCLRLLSVALRVVFVVLRLFEVVLRLLSVVLRLFECCFEVVLRLFEGVLRLFQVLF